MLSYIRKFIILKKEYSTLKGVNPKGHCKLEVRGIRGGITVNIENGEVDNYYNVLLISGDQSSLSWNLGKIFTDNLGRGKGEYGFTQRELEAKNLSLNKSAILILREGQVLLGGYIESEDGAIERYIGSMAREEAEVILEEPIPMEEIHEDYDVREVHEGIIETIQYDEVIEEAEVDEIIPEAIEEVETDDKIPWEMREEEKEDLIWEPIGELVEEQQQQVEEQILQHLEEFVVEPIEEPLEEPIEDPIEEPTEDLPEEIIEPDRESPDHGKKLNQKDQTINYVLSILRFFPYTDPFKYDLKGYNWWMVELDSDNEYKAFLPYFSYITGGNSKEAFTNATTCNHLMNKYGHYLFGLYNEEETIKYFLYGIPGGFIKEEHPYWGENGFNTWYQGQDDSGYWIIYIDPITGKPVYPKIPMVPIE